MLTFATDGRKTLQGTLAADTLDLTPYVSTVKLLAANRREWSNGPISLDGLAGTDFDLRLSAAKVILADAKLGRTAIGANLRGGHLTVTIGEAQAYGGVIKGSVALANFDAAASTSNRSCNSATSIWTAASASCSACIGWTARATSSFSVEGAGDSVLGVTRTLDGTASLTGEKGAIVGFDVAESAAPAGAAAAVRRRRFPHRAHALRQDRGGAEDRARQGQRRRREDRRPERATGAGGLGLDPRARSRPHRHRRAGRQPPKPGTPPFALPFIVQGSWDDPIMLPDAEALIRRSGAAAPLLNAVRERNARDAARSVLERLTGGAIPARRPRRRHRRRTREGPKSRNKAACGIAAARAAGPPFDYDRQRKRITRRLGGRRDGARMLYATLRTVGQGRRRLAGGGNDPGAFRHHAPIS